MVSGTSVSLPFSRTKLFLAGELYIEFTLREMFTCVVGFSYEHEQKVIRSRVQKFPA